MEINNPQVLAEVSVQFQRYQDAVVSNDIVAALERVGVRGVPTEVEFVDEIPRTAIGKSPLIRRAPPVRN